MDVWLSGAKRHTFDARRAAGDHVDRDRSGAGVSGHRSIEQPVAQAVSHGQRDCAGRARRSSAGAIATTAFLRGFEPTAILLLASVVAAVLRRRHLLFATRSPAAAAPAPPRSHAPPRRVRRGHRRPVGRRRGDRHADRDVCADDRDGHRQPRVSLIWRGLTCAFARSAMRCRRSRFRRPTRRDHRDTQARRRVAGGRHPRFGSALYLAGAARLRGAAQDTHGRLLHRRSDASQGRRPSAGERPRRTRAWRNGEAGQRERHVFAEVTALLERRPARRATWTASRSPTFPITRFPLPARSRKNDDPRDYPIDLSQFQVSDLAAVEYYPDNATMPAQFSRTSAGCGALMLWTRER